MSNRLYDHIFVSLDPNNLFLKKVVELGELGYRYSGTVELYLFQYAVFIRDVNSAVNITKDNLIELVEE